MTIKPSYRYLFSSSSKQGLLTQLKSELNWHREALHMYGRDVLVPRLVAFVADQGLSYRYTGKDHHGEGWPESLLALKQEAEAIAGQGFNAVLLNWYRDGEEYMGWHADDESSLGPAPVVAMLSLGAQRSFVFRYKQDHKIKHSLELEDGSWLIMSSSVQVLWQHTLPVRKKVKEERISLTFRRLL
ncbi:alpha-ketoglutarate-dependent dioxygenase AlkB family protein [Marinomonas posidonica]|uniref:2OG-Fe(II) oxygenase n=1 Tax=Marinomonas posidonica (strain CECT 7376 / NCIMB 14433 / IVIA-Po-181) TaxID=491952 RepID=F6CU64_MARPP|nr:alpha-ketoglutarate-dependent dioxygenase AlkB [Marinomonas posidonica]AEF54116.1 2OG-Fe(II) oxygenase [Marinomonas posidonica IVIA-Po-181]